MDDIAEVPVHGKNLGWASSQLAGAGIPYSMAGRQGSVYIILIPMAAMPMLAGAPWMYQQPSRLAGLAAFPWVKIIVAIGFMAAVVYSCQAFGMMAGFAALIANPEVQAAAQEADAKQDANPLEQVFSRLDEMQSDITRRTEAAKQDAVEAVTSTLLMYCGVPLMVVGVLAALFLVFRLRFAMRRKP